MDALQILEGGVLGLILGVHSIAGTMCNPCGWPLEALCWLSYAKESSSFTMWDIVEDKDAAWCNILC
eukprot:scaffold90709_cov28-Prasinocladus_malaysianus.AAC.2